MERTLAPVNVSPLIKGVRWGLLIAGILYGISRRSMLRKRYQKRMAELEKTRPEREAKAKFEKEKIQKEQVEELTRILGNKLA